jgi:L-alanine-DL-glutamate epimerase-like enolase superfamily enzyme
MLHARARTCQWLIDVHHEEGDVKISAVEVFVLGDSPPRDPADEHIAQLAVVRIGTDEGITGLSEIFSVPPGVAKAALDGPDSFFGRHLIGEDPLPPERLWTKLYGSMLHGNRRGWAIICLGAADVALWDIYGKALGRPVYALLGGAERSPYQVYDDRQRGAVAPYCTIISRDWDHESVLRQQIERVEALRALGFRAMKIEPMRSAPETIVELARRARSALGDEGLLAVDVGYLWNEVDVAWRVAERLLEHNVFFLETPFPVDALAAYTRLAARTRLPIAAGEHTVTRWEFLDLMDRGSVQVIQPYMTTVGGLTEARRVLELALARGVLVCPGNWSTQILGTATLHLAAISPMTPTIEYAPAQIYDSPLRRALQALAPPVVDGAIAWPAAPGIGIDLPADLVAHFRVG